MKTRNIGIDFLRILASAGVIGLHGLCTQQNAYTLYLYYLCGFSVPVFFTVSGYFLFQKAEITSEYLLRKILQYLRLILIWALIAFVFDDILLVYYGGSPKGFLHFLEILVGSFFTTNWLGHLWYLWASLLTYLLITLITYFFKDLPENSSKWWLAFLFLSVLLQLISYLRGKPEVAGTRFNALRLWTCLQYMFLGSVMPLFSNALKKLPLAVHFAVLLLFSAAASFYFYYICQKLFAVDFVHNMYDSLVMIAWVILIFTFFLRLEIKSKLLISLTNLLAPLTLGIYVFQSFILTFLSGIEWMEYPNGSIVKCGVAFVICAGLTWVLKKLPGSKYYLSI